MKKLILIGVVLALFFSSACYAAEDPYQASRTTILLEWQTVKVVDHLWTLTGKKEGGLKPDEPDALPEIPYYTAFMARSFDYPLYYADHDFNRDGVNELVVAYGMPHENDIVHHILGIYVYDGAQMRYLFREIPLREKVNLMTFDPDAMKMCIVESFGATDNYTYTYTLTPDILSPKVESVHEIQLVGDYAYFMENLTYTQLTAEDHSPLPID